MKKSPPKNNIIPIGRLRTYDFVSTYPKFYGAGSSARIMLKKMNSNQFFGARTENLAAVIKLKLPINSLYGKKKEP